MREKAQEREREGERMKESPCVVISESTCDPEINAGVTELL